MDKELTLVMEITELILQVADLSEEVSRSDLQGAALGKAMDIIEMLRKKEMNKMIDPEESEDEAERG